jgi:hypothetical protein
MIWREDSRAATYTVEFCRDPAFGGEVIAAVGIDMPFYNHSETFAAGTWYWRYTVVTGDGERSSPSPVRSFVIDERSVSLPVPPTSQILASMPGHPRIYTTPATLDAYRARRFGPAKSAWEDTQRGAEEFVDDVPVEPVLRPVPDPPPKGRGILFYVKDGQTWMPGNYTVRDANSDSAKAAVLGRAYLVTGDARYGAAARRRLLALSHVRVDAHLEDREAHDTVVYCFEYGLKNMAVTFDHIYDVLDESDRQQILAAIEYHGEAAYGWCRRKLKLHLNYQNSHGQQCMHALLTTALAVATEFPAAREWTDYLVRQYVNRVAWGASDGGYSEGQTYAHKVQFILDGLYALRTATGIDVYRKPRWHNTGDFWLHCMSLNYWWNHWGDTYPLLMPMHGNGADGYISNFLASIHGNRYLKWWSDAVVAKKAHGLFHYFSDEMLTPKPPVDIPQARVFEDVGHIAAYDRFYDHQSNRLFFRSSQWGAASHAHADQNGFVLHAGGEVMACDAGYYTYYGDDYHRNFSMQTIAHNSMLVDGEGQPKNIDAKGDVTAFFNTPRACFFVGDASDAYGGKLSRFRRSVLFCRPDLFVMFDDVAAPEASAFTWLMHTFESADIDDAARTMLVRQRDQRLSVQHVAPEALAYSQSNERPHPMKTRRFTRYTEMFPQQWTIRVTTAQKDEQARFLTVMHAYDVKTGPRLDGIERLEQGDWLGISYRRGGHAGLAAFRQVEGRVGASVAEFATDAAAISALRDEDGDLLQWLAHGCGKVEHSGVVLFASPFSCDVAVDCALGAASAQVCIAASKAGTVKVHLPGRPRTVLASAPSRYDEALPRAFEWSDGMLTIEVEAGDTVLWIDPKVLPGDIPATVPLVVKDSRGSARVELETAVADNGEIVAFGVLAPPEPGLYDLVSSRPGTELFAQDKWDPAESRRGTDSARALLRERTELFARFVPDGGTPELTATLVESHRGRVISLLRNGDFEEGIPLYPPRGWSVKASREDDSVSWPHWSQNDPCEGDSCLRLVRGEHPVSTVSQPMILPGGGRYVLRFRARGNAADGRVTVSGAHKTGITVEVSPSEDWLEYSTEVDILPGYCGITVGVGGASRSGQELCIDAMEFGPIAE